MRARPAQPLRDSQQRTGDLSADLCNSGLSMAGLGIGAGLPFTRHILAAPAQECKGVMLASLDDALQLSVQSGRGRGGVLHRFFSGFTVHHEPSRSGCAGSVMLWTCRP